MSRIPAYFLALSSLCVACAGQQTDTASPDPSAATTTADAATAEPVAPIPEGWFELTPQIAVDDVDAAVEFYGKAFGAQKLYAMPGPEGKTMHAEIKIGDSLIMIDAANEQLKSPKTLGGSPISMMIYVANAEEVFAAAVAAGGTALGSVEAQFWGDKFGQLSDPFGHTWSVATQVEDLTDEQIKQRGDLFAAEMAEAAKSKKKKKKKGKKPAEPSWKSVVGKPAKDPVPSDYHTVTMAVVVPDAKAALEFYQGALGATVKDRMDMPNGKLMHAEIRIGSSALMLSEEMPEFGTKSAGALGGSPVIIHHYVADADAVFGKATGAGGKSIYPLNDAPWGDRYGAVEDPAGLPWGIATHKEDLSPEQINERMKKSMEAEAGAKPETAAAPDAATAPEPAAAPAEKKPAAAAAKK